MKRLVFVLLLFLLLSPVVLAQEEQEEKCGITNLGSCLPEKFFGYLLSIVNAPLQPLLNTIKDLLTEPVDTSLFLSIWVIMIYVISIFYGLFFMFAGVNLMISGYDSAKREKAKLWLRNTVLMVFFVQASYFIYSLVLEVSSLMTAGVVNMISQDFFLITVDNISNVALELVFYVPYLIILLITTVLLVLRYLFVASGIIFFPFALFLYFIEPLRSYGKVIIDILLIVIFLPFIEALILLAASLLVEIPIFANTKILVMISTFLLVDLVMIGLAVFAIVKSAMAIIKSDVGKAVIAGAKYAI